MGLEKNNMCKEEEEGVIGDKRAPVFIEWVVDK